MQAFWHHQFMLWFQCSYLLFWGSWKMASTRPYFFDGWKMGSARFFLSVVMHWLGWLQIGEQPNCLASWFPLTLWFVLSCFECTFFVNGMASMGSEGILVVCCDRYLFLKLLIAADFTSFDFATDGRLLWRCTYLFRTWILFASFVRWGVKKLWFARSNS